MSTSTFDRFDLFDPQLRVDPYPALARLREAGDGVHRVDPGFWLVTRHADVQRLRRDAASGVIRASRRCTRSSARSSPAATSSGVPRG